MRAAVTVIFFVVLGVVVDACSSNAIDDGCYSDGDCGPGYRCDDSTGACYASMGGGSETCSVPSDCPVSYTCGKEGRCLPGDCFFHGCVTGFECQSTTGVWRCEPTSAGAAGASGNQDTSEAGTGGVVEAAGQSG